MGASFESVRCYVLRCLQAAACHSPHSLRHRCDVVRALPPRGAQCAPCVLADACARAARTPRSERSTGDDHRAQRGAWPAWDQVEFVPWAVGPLRRPLRHPLIRPRTGVVVRSPQPTIGTDRRASPREPPGTSQPLAALAPDRPPCARWRKQFPHYQAERRQERQTPLTSASRRTQSRHRLHLRQLLATPSSWSREPGPFRPGTSHPYAPPRYASHHRQASIEP